MVDIWERSEMNQILSQDELSALLESLASKEPHAVTASGAPASISSPSVDAERISLAGYERISRGRLPGLEIIAERFSREFRVKLSQQLARSCSVQADGIETTSFASFSKGLSHPSNMHLFKLKPLRGQALLFFSPELAYHIVEAQFGGSVQRARKPAAKARDFSQIEQRILAKVAMLALDVFQDVCAEFYQLEVVYSSSESNPLTLQIASPSDQVAQLKSEVEIDGCTGMLAFCLPLSMLAPLRERLSSGHQGSTGDKRAGKDLRIVRHLKQTEVQVSVELARGTVKVRDILALQVGDLLELSTPAGDPARVYVEGEAKYLANVGASRGSKAITITSAVASTGRKDS
jgi:flagellar motor switch protein FliM